MTILPNLLRNCLLAACAGAAVLAHGALHAQAYPSKPVKLMVGFAPGGIADIVTRLIGQGLTQHLGEPVVVENKPGADSRIALQQLAAAPPDGYLINLSDASLAVNAVLYATKAYDPLKDFTPLLFVGEVPNFIAVSPSVSANTLSEFIDYAKANKGKLNYAAGGGATMLGTEIFKSAANVDIRYIPYKGQPMGLAALMTGDVHLMVSSVGPLTPLVKQNKIKALAVTSRKRTPLAPDVPTTTEAGLPAMVYTNWFVILGPAGMPKPVVERLQSDLRKVMADPTIITRLKEMGIEPSTTSPEEFTVNLGNELTKMESIVKSANLKIE
jgi:tripartite-type tricarboxylate transporter receptor subunit TctC